MKLYKIYFKYKFRLCGPGLTITKNGMNNKVSYLKFTDYQLIIYILK